MTSMPKARALRAIACPIRPIPTMPRVRPASWTPTYFARSHPPDRKTAFELATFLAREIISANACSAVVIVLAEAEFMTATPSLVAVGR